MSIEKSYLSFTLDVKRIFPIWFLFVGLVLAPYVLQYMALTSGEPVNYPVQREFYLINFLYALLVGLGYLLFYYKFAILIISSISYKDQNLEFTENFFSYFVLVISGVFLSIITLGIYIPWFIASLNRFFTDYTRYKDSYFEFKGKGVKLFVIGLLYFFLPLFGLGICMAILAFVFKGQIDQISPRNLSQNLIFVQVATQIIFNFLAIPFFYLSFKWRVNTSYKDYSFKLISDFFPAVFFAAGQFFLTVISVGIYLPLAFLNLYRYFLGNIEGHGSGRTLRIRYELESSKDFLFIWKQFLLVIVSLGFYYPWALKNMGAYIIGKTSLETRYDPIMVEEIPELPLANLYAQAFEKSEEELPNAEPKQAEPMEPVESPETED